MDSSQMDDRGPGKNKRKWSLEEDDALVSALLDLVNAGTHQADNGFKPGYSAVLEKTLERSLPGSGIKAKPNIESRIKTLKRDFNIVHDMLHGPNTSGFGYDSEKKMVTASKPVWDAYLQSHKNAHPFRNKSFPHYEDLATIFGKDRATGVNAQTAADIVEEMEKNGEDDANQDNDSSSFILPQSSAEASSRRVKKKRSADDSMVEGMKQAATIIGNNINQVLQVFSDSFGVDAKASEKRGNINKELLKMSGITMVERHKAMVRIGQSQELTDLFFSVEDHEKEEWVKALLRGDF